ncbi:hypothetical protein [Maricaulis salignorans]|uniref:Uncharacterized protein n=1 Tax=Maricaulis salignorans TaxID=144026 RepID=A0A1G9WR46_9PROT|nr:hypothetical protein [Maricaulis salignorans]SDM87032.1 hypothetical protein SAMN04488568_12712 [Maricaulis salignorans]
MSDEANQQASTERPINGFRLPNWAKGIGRAAIAPNWWSAVSSVGLLLLGAYLAFWSPLSDAIEAELRAERAQLLTDVVDRQAQLGRLTEEKSAAENQIEVLSRDIAARSNDLADAQSELADAERFLETAESQAAAAQESLEITARQREQAETQRDRARNELASLNQEIVERSERSTIDAMLGRERLSPIFGATSLLLTEEYRQITSREEIDGYLIASHDLISSRLANLPETENDEAIVRGITRVVDRWENACSTTEQWFSLTRTNSLFERLEMYRHAVEIAANHPIPDGPINTVEDINAQSVARGERYELEREAQRINFELREMLHQAVIEAAESCLDY